MCKFKFNETLAEYILSEGSFFKKNLVEISRLKSSYAITYYTIAKSWSGMAGKKGNRAGEWFFEYSIDGLRKVLSVKDTEYQDMRNFNRRCVDLPLEEVNKKSGDFTISAEKIKSGKKIVAYRFHCAMTGNKKDFDVNYEMSDYTLIQRHKEFVIYSLSLEYL